MLTCVRRGIYSRRRHQRQHCQCPSAGQCQLTRGVSPHFALRLAPLGSPPGSGGEGRGGRRRGGRAGMERACEGARHRSGFGAGLWLGGENDDRDGPSYPGEAGGGGEILPVLLRQQKPLAPGESHTALSVFFGAHQAGHPQLQAREEACGCLRGCSRTCLRPTRS